MPFMVNYEKLNILRVLQKLTPMRPYWRSIRSTFFGGKSFKNWSLSGRRPVGCKSQVYTK